MLGTIKKGVRSLLTLGYRETWRLFLQGRKRNALEKRLQHLVLLPDEQREQQQNTRFKKPIKVSVLTPLYNTPMGFLEEMIKSVQAQTYGYWELCLCDGSDSDHDNVGEFCLTAAKEDPRIKYRKLAKNDGISANTNACVELSTGDYLAPLDHDDVLHPAALYEAVSAICEKGADFIYTDETKFSTDVTKPFGPNFKPDFAKDELRAHNYICHFTVYSRKLLDKAGAYSSEYDGSQDHDAVLRMTELADCIVHIPKILYFWRVHSDSVSAGVEVKAYAINAAHKAVAAQLARCGEHGTVTSIPSYPLLYKTDYDISDNPGVSVILHGLSTAEAMVRCVKAMEEMTSHYPVELCLVEGSIETKVFREALRTLPTVKPIRVLTKEMQRAEESVFDLAVKQCSGDYIVFLHEAAVLEAKDWVREMLMLAQRSDVGAVGVKLLDSNRSVFSLGIALDAETPSLLHRLYQGEPQGSHGYEAGLFHVRNVTAVDGHCLMISKEKYLKTGGIRKDLGDYQFLDLCLRLREAGLLNICTPFASAVYWGDWMPSGETRERFRGLWDKALSEPDPYYNPNIREYRLY